MNAPHTLDEETRTAARDGLLARVGSRLAEVTRQVVAPVDPLTPVLGEMGALALDLAKTELLLFDEHRTFGCYKCLLGLQISLQGVLDLCRRELEVPIAALDFVAQGCLAAGIESEPGVAPVELLSPRGIEVTLGSRPNGERAAFTFDVWRDGTLMTNTSKPQAADKKQPDMTWNRAGGTLPDYFDKLTAEMIARELRGHLLCHLWSRLTPDCRKAFPESAPQETS